MPNESDIPELDGPLLDEILSDPDRDRIPGALPIVSVHENDEPEFLAALRDRARTRMELRRRGQLHGTLVELHGKRSEFSGRELVKRWKNAAPVLLPGLLADEVAGSAEARADYDLLRETGGLRAWLRANKTLWNEQFELSPEDHEARDADRDLECVSLRARGELSDVPLWLKTGRLSTFADDASLRLRMSFGKEIEDDANPDPRGHQAVRALAECLLPLSTQLHSNEALARTLTKAFGGQSTFSQHIRYWNAPEGGARFHHDAFGLPDPSGQRGVAYLQVSGATLWIALSIRALAHNVLMFAEMLADGELRPLRETLFPGESLVKFITLARDEEKCIHELSQPGCGKLGQVVDLGPEFTALLADGGHALRVEAGDVLLLPNHGYDRTAMHSVFCASEQPGEALSVAIRKIDSI